MLNPNRNPELSRTQIESFSKPRLGCAISSGSAKVSSATIPTAISTTSRASSIRRPLPVLLRRIRKTIITAACEKTTSVCKALEIQDGRKLDIISLPCPAPLFSAGARLPASYANFYIANEVVLVPVFDDANDKLALGILQEFFPKRKIIALRCNEVVAGLGAIHCVTQQEPAVR